MKYILLVIIITAAFLMHPYLTQSKIAARVPIILSLLKQKIVPPTFKDTSYICIISIYMQLAKI